MSFNKKFYKSKTMWASLLTILVTTIVPDAKEFISEHPDYAMSLIGMVFGVLRIKTTESIGIKR